MRTYLHFDFEGAIHSVVRVNAPAGAGMMLASRAGLSVAEAEGVKLKGDETDVERVRALAKTHMVSPPVVRPTPARKRY